MPRQLGNGEGTLPQTEVLARQALRVRVVPAHRVHQIRDAGHVQAVNLLMWRYALAIRTAPHKKTITVSENSSMADVAH